MTLLEVEQLATIQVLVVEDESIIARDIKDCLENLGYGVPAIASSGAEAIQKAAELRPNLVLMDIRLKGDMDGIQAAEQIWSRFSIPIIYSTGFSDRNTLERAKLTRPFGYILKPIEERELYVAIETALQQHRVNQELQNREQWLNTVLRDLGDGVIVVDTQGQIRLLNLVAEALTGWTLTDAVGKELGEVFHVIDEETQAPIENPIAAVIQQGRLVYLPNRVQLVTRNGSMLPIADSIAPLRDERENITGAVIVFRDVTQRRLLEERDFALQQSKNLQAQMQELEQLNQLKDEFLDTVSHELRTPLANMKMAIEMLEIVLNQQGYLSANTEANRLGRYFSILRDQCNHELSLVNDLLDLQRLNSDRYILSLDDIVLQDRIPHIIENFEQRIQQNNQRLRVEIEPNLPPLTTDSASLARILSELLNNACKYTPNGEEIAVTAQVINTLDSDIHSPQIQITVTNSGVEIPEDELSRVFDRFYRVPNTDIRRQGGTGLGLALVRKLVIYMEGSITVETCAGQISFVVKLPLALGRSSS